MLKPSKTTLIGTSDYITYYGLSTDNDGVVGVELVHSNNWEQLHSFCKWIWYTFLQRQVKQTNLVFIIAWQISFFQHPAVRKYTISAYKMNRAPPPLSSSRLRTLIRQIELYEAQSIYSIDIINYWDPFWGYTWVQRAAIEVYKRLNIFKELCRMFSDIEPEVSAIFGVRGEVFWRGFTKDVEIVFQTYLKWDVIYESG